MTASRFVGGPGTPFSRPPPSRDSGRAVVTPPTTAYRPKIKY